MAKRKARVERVEADQVDEAKIGLLEYFPELFLGERCYPWQFNVLKALGERESRVLLCAANGSGKTSKVAAAAVLWHMIRFPGSLVVVTAGVYRQVAVALWQHLRLKTQGLGGEAMGWKVTEDSVIYDAPAGLGQSRCVGFSVSDPNKAEGWHRQGKDDNLLYIIDEAKGVPDGVFDAMERCQPSRLLVMSSPGAPSGRFYNLFSRGGPEYQRFRVTAFDCPHLTKEWIETQIRNYGEKSPLVRSMIYAEFAEEDNKAMVLPVQVLQKALSSPPAKVAGKLTAGCDFAAGGDENVLAVREGNYVRQIISWREKDTMAAVGRFITEFKRLGLKAEDVWADAGGLGLPMCDALREAGWDVRRVNNGEASYDPDKFANRGTEMWVRYARLVETGKVILPDDDQLHRQLTTRELKYNSRGKLVLESKDDLRKRGLDSPDRADAVVLAFCGGGVFGEDFSGLGGGHIKGSLLEQLDELGEPISSANSVLAGCKAGFY